MVWQDSARMHTWSHCKVGSAEWEGSVIDVYLMPSYSFAVVHSPKLLQPIWIYSDPHGYLDAARWIHHRMRWRRRVVVPTIIVTALREPSAYGLGLRTCALTLSHWRARFALWRATFARSCRDRSIRYGLRLRGPGSGLRRGNGNRGLDIASVFAHAKAHGDECSGSVKIRLDKSQRDDIGGKKRCSHDASGPQGLHASRSVLLFTSLPGAVTPWSYWCPAMAAIAVSHHITSKLWCSSLCYVWYHRAVLCCSV